MVTAKSPGGWNMKQTIESFIERVKVESNIHKFIQEALIYKLITNFRKNYVKMNYPKKINNPLDIVLKFYKNYNKEYYEIILDGINSSRIIISKNETKSFASRENKRTNIKLSGNDSDVFILAHEFAHYIDINFNPPIIPYEYDFLCEVFSFFIEKHLELWLEQKEFNELKEVRRNNRMYYEEKMLNAIEYELFCEKNYIKNGQIGKEDLDINRVKELIHYDYDLNVGLVNYLLRYPLANILSDYLVNNNMIKNDSDICSVCLRTNLYEVITNNNKINRLVSRSSK